MSGRITPEGRQFYLELKKKDVERCAKEAQEEDCYFTVMSYYTPDLRKDWWPDGSLKYNCGHGPLPRGLYRVDCYGYNVHHQKDPSQLRPPNISSEPALFSAWIKEMSPLIDKEREKAQARSEHRAKVEADKAKARMDAFAALHSPNENHPLRIAVKQEIAQLLHERKSRVDPVIKINPMQTKKRNRAYYEAAFDTAKTYLIACGILLIIALYIAVDSETYKNSNGSLGTLFGMAILIVVGCIVCFPLLIGLITGCDAPYTDRGVNKSNKFKAEQYDCFFNPPEDYRVGTGTFNSRFYPDGSLKYVSDGVNDIQISRGLYFKDCYGHDVYMNNRKGPQPPNPKHMPELFQLWLQEIKKIPL